MQTHSATPAIPADVARAWAAAWQRAAPELDRVRRRELGDLSTDEAMANLAPLFADALRLPPRTTSGLVEQQRLFAKVFG